MTSAEIIGGTKVKLQEAMELAQSFESSMQDAKNPTDGFR